MTDDELLIECKKGLSIPTSSTGFDGVLMQKLLVVKSFMRSAGVSDVAMLDDAAIGVIVMGVTTIWNLDAGGIKFPPAFYTLLTQLTFGDSTLSFTSNVLDEETGVAVSVWPVLTFNKRLTSYDVSMVNLATLTPNQVSITPALDITGKILTITPSSDLTGSTNYAIVVNSATAFSGQTLDYTTISFTTA